MNNEKDNGSHRQKNNMKLIINLNENNRGIKFKRNLFIKQNDIDLMNLLKKRGVLEEVKVFYSKNPLSKSKKRLPKIDRKVHKKPVQRVLNIEKRNRNKEEQKHLDMSLPLKYKSPKFENQLLKNNESLNRDNCIQCLNNHNNMRQILFNVNKKPYDNVIHINNINKRNIETTKVMNNFNNFSFQNLIKSQSSRNLKQPSIIRKLNNPLANEDKIINKSVNSNIKGINLKHYLKQIQYEPPNQCNEKGSQTLREDNNHDEIY